MGQKMNKYSGYLVSLDEELTAPKKGAKDSAPPGGTRQFSDADTPVGSGHVTFWGSAQSCAGVFYGHDGNAYFVPDDPTAKVPHNLALLDMFSSTVAQHDGKPVASNTPDVLRFGADSFILRDPVAQARLPNAAADQYVSNAPPPAPFG